MTFANDGFLSPSMQGFRASLRKVSTYDQWFQFAEDLNRFSLSILWNHEVPSADNQKVTTCALFVRAQQSFQAAVLLAELGMLSDARVVLRSAVEGAIALHGLEGDNTFIDQLVEAHRIYQRKIARLVLTNPDYKASHSAEQIKQMEETINEIDSIEAAKGGNLRDIKWDQVATKHCKDLYDLLYRLLSSDGTHTNLNAIQRFLSFDKNDELVGMKVGPDVTDLVDVLSMACLMLLWAVGPFIRVFAKQGYEEKLQEYMRRFTELPHSEPADVRVEGNYQP
jgi:hypothetical protein